MSFTEKFITYAEESTDCPRILLEWSAILALSSVLGRKVYFDYGDGGLAANIWVILIGPSSMHKSTALHLASNLIKAVNPDGLYPQGWTKEAIWEEISKHPIGTFIYDEAKSFFDCCSASYNVGSMNDITSMFGGQGLKRTTKKQTIEIIDPYIGFGGASTAEWMIEGIKDKQSAILSGFLPRFLLVSSGPSLKHYPWYRPVDKIKKMGLIEQLREFALLEGPMRYDEPAEKAFEAWDAMMYAKIVRLEKHSLPYVPFLNKMTTLYPHKLAIIAAIDDGTFPIITLESWLKVERWLALIEHSLTELLGSLVQTPWDKMRAKAVLFLSSRLDCTREEFGDETRIRGKDADMMLRGLENDGKITLRKMEKTTKPITVIQWVGNGTNHENRT